MQDARQHQPSNYDLARQGFSIGSMVRASHQCMEGHVFNFCRGLTLFPLSHASDMLQIPSSYFQDSIRFASRTKILEKTQYAPTTAQ